MSQYLPFGGFKWVNPEEWSADKIQALGNEDATGLLDCKKNKSLLCILGYFFEVDLEYPQHLHDAHNEYPFG